MLPYGSDRSRMVAGKVILQSAIPKGWYARVPKQGTHSEFPGTTVLWDEQYFEVLEAVPLQSGGVRYVLVPWRDELTIRVFEHYDAPSEAARLADHELARKQRRLSAGARLAGIVLGFLPEHVQNHLGNELGVSPSRMTLLSTIPGVVFLGVCVWMQSGAMLGQGSRVPLWMWFVALLLLFESALRFLIAMTQSRGVGSLPGTLGYVLFWYLTPRRGTLPSPFERARGDKIVITEPTADVALRDRVEMRSPLMTLLTPREQSLLAQKYGFDYRRHARGVAWTLLLCASLGVTTSFIEMLDERSPTALISLAIAGWIVLEQAVRLSAFRRGPAGSFLGTLVRPFLRDLLERG